MISKHTAPAYTWGHQCDGWRLVDEEERSIIHERMPEGTSEIRHYHNKSKQFFFVLLGTLNIEIDGVEHVIQEQEGIDVLPPLPHQVFNRTGTPIEFLVISQPHTRNDRIQVEAESH